MAGTAMDAYLAALTLLSRRELSAAQLRERLLRKKYDPEAIDQALERLTADRTLDDRRVAVASARLEASVRGRGRRRVLQAVKRLGISPDLAESAVAEVFNEVDESALLDRAVEKRLKGQPLSELDEKGRARLVRHLIARGFEPGRVFARLRAPYDTTE